MSYDYVKRTYNVTPVVGERVTHQTTHKSGTIMRESKSASHYVWVRFDNRRFGLPCHPTELDYHGRGKIKDGHY